MSSFHAILILCSWGAPCLGSLAKGQWCLSRLPWPVWIHGASSLFSDPSARDREDVFRCKGKCFAVFKPTVGFKSYFGDPIQKETHILDYQCFFRFCLRHGDSDLTTMLESTVPPPNLESISIFASSLGKFHSQATLFCFFVLGECFLWGNIFFGEPTLATLKTPLTGGEGQQHQGSAVLRLCSCHNFVAKIRG